MSNFSQFSFLPLHGSKTSNYYMALLLPIRATTKTGSPRSTGKTTKTQTAGKRERGELDELTTPTVTGSKREWTEHL